MKAFARILFQVKPLDTDFEGIFLQIDRNHPFADDGVLILRDLIALRQIGIEIVLPVEDGIIG